MYSRATISTGDTECIYAYLAIFSLFLYSLSSGFLNIDQSFLTILLLFLFACLSSSFFSFFFSSYASPVSHDLCCFKFTRKKDCREECLSQGYLQQLSLKQAKGKNHWFCKPNHIEIISAKIRHNNEELFSNIKNMHIFLITA